MSEHTSQQAVQQAVQQATNNPLHNYVTKNLNTVGDDTASPAQTKPKRKCKATTPEECTPAHRIWLVYSEAYRGRYRKDPFKNGGTYSAINSMLKQVNEEELAKRVKFYVSSFNENFIIEHCHRINLLSTVMDKVANAMGTTHTTKKESTYGYD